MLTVIQYDLHVWSGVFNGTKVVLCAYQESSSDLSNLRKRAAAIAQVHPDSILVFLNNTHIITMTSLSGVHSGSVLKDVLATVGGKGGGSAKYAEGKLNEYSSKVIQTLKQVFCCKTNNKTDLA